MSYLSDNGGYRLSAEGSRRLVALMESGPVYTLPPDYGVTVERDPEKSLERLRASGFMPPA